MERAIALPRHPTGPVGNSSQTADSRTQDAARAKEERGPQSRARKQSTRATNDQAKSRAATADPKPNHKQRHGPANKLKTSRTLSRSSGRRSTQLALQEGVARVGSLGLFRVRATASMGDRISCARLPLQSQDTCTPAPISWGVSTLDSVVLGPYPDHSARA